MPKRRPQSSGAPGEWLVTERQRLGAPEPAKTGNERKNLKLWKEAAQDEEAQEGTGASGAPRPEGEKREAAMEKEYEHIIFGAGLEVAFFDPAAYTTSIAGRPVQAP